MCGMAQLRDLLTFPNPVNEVAARVVASGVVLLAVLALVTGSPWVLLVMALGFALRVAAGPRFSPLGRLAAQVIAPRIAKVKLVPGPPKRFAQTIGLAFATAATVLALLGFSTAATVLLAVLLTFAALEAFVGFCAGCFLFAQLMRVGLIPEQTCAACSNIWLRPGATTAS